MLASLLLYYIQQLISKYFQAYTYTRKTSVKAALRTESSSSICFNKSYAT